MLNWTSLLIFKRILGELKWKLTASFFPFVCDLGRLHRQREATRGKSLPSLLPCAEFAPGVRVARVLPSTTGHPLWLQWCQTAQSILSSGKTREEMGMALSLFFELCVPTSV